MLVLASSSPRRQELLRNARILYKTLPADVSEIREDKEPSVDFARRMARDKARAVFEQLRPAPGTFVLGADTIVVVESEVLGKPADEDDAFRMLRLLSGRQHEVTTGVCLIGVSPVERLVEAESAASKLPPQHAKTGRDGDIGDIQVITFEDVRSETTEVTFCSLTDSEINDYIATGEPMDKAGAYAIQGAASRWVPHIDGCYFNVMGLPVPLIYRMLVDHGGL
jgi:septum formation protein